MKKLLTVAALATSVITTAAFAAPVPDGTVSSVATFNPAVAVSATPATYSAMNGGTIEISGTGGYAAIGGTTGSLNGTLMFSSIVGTITPESIANFFTFSDARGGSYNFSTTSVQTNSFVNTPAFTSGTLYVLGNVLDMNLGLTSTLSSLSIQFNSTGGSAFSSALTLSTPPAGAGAVPEPATWAMMMIGIGLIGTMVRRRNRVTTRVRFA